MTPEELHLEVCELLEVRRLEAAALLAELRHATAHTDTEVQCQIARMEAELKSAAGRIEDKQWLNEEALKEIKQGLNQAWANLREAGQRAMQGWQPEGEQEIF